jgi:hypothetical protein
MKMADIRVDSSGPTGTINVDGVRLSSVTRIGVEFSPGVLPVVNVSLHALPSTFVLDGATLKIGGIEAPEALERAMLAYLQDKYPPAPLLQWTDWNAQWRSELTTAAVDDEQSVGDHFFPLVQDAIALMQSPGSDLIEVVSTWGAAPEHVEPPSPLTRVAPIGVRPL